MLDMKLVRERPEFIREMLIKRGVAFPLERLLGLDGVRRDLITKAQELKRMKNRVSIEIGEMKKEGDHDPSTKIIEMKRITDEIASADKRVATLEGEITELMLALPNIPHESVHVGGDESANVEVRRWGAPRNFTFEPKDHIDLASRLSLIDVERAAKVAGSRFYFLMGDLVRLNFALIQFGLDFIEKRGFKLMQPPYMLKREAISGAIIFSDFQEVIYKVEGEDLYLIGTAEHAAAAMHLGETFGGSELPLMYGGVSPCFRKEAGAHGRDTKGIFRVHQFEKVEQFVFCIPEDSWSMHEALVKNAEDFCKALGIPYRVVLLCTGDMGKVSAKTYDIEVWLPGQGNFREVVSCSNCTDYQARRLGIRYREKPHEQAKFVHTLNSTLVATERMLIAILENFQQEDGSIAIPEVLQPYMGGAKVISAKAG